MTEQTIAERSAPALADPRVKAVLDRLEKDAADAVERAYTELYDLVDEDLLFPPWRKREEAG